jgi:hypothetical protein
MKYCEDWKSSNAWCISFPVNSAAMVDGGTHRRVRWTTSVFVRCSQVSQICGREELLGTGRDSAIVYEEGRWDPVLVLVLVLVVSAAAEEWRLKGADDVDIELGDEHYIGNDTCTPTPLSILAVLSDCPLLDLFHFSRSRWFQRRNLVRESLGINSDTIGSAFATDAGVNKSW